MLRAINILYANIINQIVNRKELKQNYTIQLEDIEYGKKATKISALILKVIRLSIIEKWLEIQEKELMILPL